MNIAYPILCVSAGPEITVPVMTSEDRMFRYIYRKMSDEPRMKAFMIYPLSYPDPPDEVRFLLVDDIAAKQYARGIKMTWQSWNYFMGLNPFRLCEILDSIQ